MNITNMQTLITHLQWLRDNDKTYKFNMAVFLSVRDADPLLPRHACSINNLRHMIREQGKDYAPSATECGTVACLAGHVALLADAPGDADVEYFARDWLGLTGDQAYTLFYGHWSLNQRGNITLDEAIAHLETLVTQESAQ